MKRAGILFLAVMLMGAPAFAEVGSEISDRVGHWDIGVQGGGGFVDATNLDDTGWLQGGLSYGVTPWLALGVSGGWTESTNSAGGDTGIADVMGDIILRVPNHPWDTRLVPYGVVGLGGMWSYAEVDNQSDRDDSSFAWKIGGGLDWWINDNWILNFEVAYHKASDNLPVDHLATNDDEIGVTTVVAGLKFMF